MSKSRKNTVDPFTLIQKYGADSVRWYLITQSPVWRPTLFDEEGVGEVQRKFFSTLLNSYAFFALYANVDGFTGTEPLVPYNERPEIDRWILSELNSLIKLVTEYLEAYDLTKAARAISDFTIDQLSNWYVRRNRRRFWKSEKGKDKIAAYQTLHECLLSISKLIAPFAPFIAEELYQIFTVDTGNSQESVHLEMLPTVKENVINPELEHKMEQAIHIVSIVRSMRMKANLKVRQPLQKIIIPVLNEAQRIEIEQIKDVILDEINVKSIEYVTDETTLIKKKAKPNFKTLGPKFGKQVQQVASRVRELTNEEIKSLQQNGSLTLTVENTTITIDPTDVEIIHEDIPGWLVETDGSFTVALDTALTPELIDEGFAREFVNRIQNLRKDNGLEVTDRIVIFHSSSDRLLQALNRMANYIKQETLALEIVSVTPQQAATMNAIEEDINGEKTAIVVQKK